MSRGRRKPRGKVINPKFYVFCEGETEAKYVRFLRAQYRLPIEPKIARSSISKKYIDNYKKGKEMHPKDKTFLLYDLDDKNIVKRLEEIDNATLLGSNPCIELWFLLHYQEQKGYIKDAKECISLLRKHYPKYEKPNLDKALKTVLEKQKKKATNRAKKLTEKENPSSTVFKLIEELDKIK